MNVKSIVFLFTVLLVLGAQAGFSQTQKEPMTNADVVALVKAGYPDSIVVLAIQKSIPNFDTSSEALIELRKQGVGPKIVKAILEARAPDSEPNADSNEMPGPAPNEVIMIDGEERIPMIRSQMQTRVTPLFLIFGTSKSLRILDGKKAGLRTHNRLPEFEVSLPSDLSPLEQLVLVRLKSKPEKREAEIGRYSLTKAKGGFQKKSIMQTTIEEISTYSSPGGTKYKLYRVKVVNPLDPGEYAFAPRSWIYSLFDFGVDADMN